MNRRVTPKINKGTSVYAFPRRVAHGWLTKSKGISIFISLMLFGSSLVMASTQIPSPKPLLLQSSAVIRQELPPLITDTAATPTYFFSPVSSAVTTQHSQVSLGQALLKQIPVVAKKTTLPSKTFWAQAKPKIMREGTQLVLNGRTLNVAWRQWQLGNSVRLGISDAGLKQSLGVELLSTKDASRQPVQWFSSNLILTSQLSAVSRFLDVTDFASSAGWQLQVKDNILQITSAPARVLNIRPGLQDWGSRIVVDLDRPTPWQFSDQRTEGAIAIEASIEPSLVAQFNTPPVQTPPVQQRQDAEDAAPVAVAVKTQQAAIRIENTPKQTILRVVAPEGKRLQVYSAANPNRLIIDVRPDALVEKEILWAPGIQWRQQYLNLKNAKFPVVWLEVDPTRAGISLRPIWSNPNTQVGTAPILQTAQLWQAAAAINAGFFNRTNQLPLGAIRRDRRWYSGPILNRGAIAWTDNGQFKFGRLSLQENLLISNTQRLPILFLNSGYVQPGIARYTPEWGQTYTPLSDNEILVFVQNGQVANQISGGVALKTAFGIPTDGYLLTLRKSPTSANLLTTGTPVSIEQGTMPSDFANYPHILGAGPLLLQNQQVVLDAKAEQFSDAFIRQFAIRSCIGTTTSGTLLIAAIHNRIGGNGPNLTETAQLMQLLGAVDALNFDGGSSTGLDLGGQLLDRSPATVARVHNGLGIFRVSPP